MLKRLCMATLLALVLAPLTASAAAAPRWHVDRQAGVKFVVPFKAPKILRGGQIEAVVRKQLGSGYPEDIHYTSGVYADDNVPYVIVWTKKAEGGVTRALADSLATDKHAQAQLGFQEFTFDKAALRGEGSLPEQGGLKVKILLQLVKDRFTYVGYYYRTPAQLKEWDAIRRSLKVGRISKLTYAMLPTGETKTGWGWLMTLLGWIAVIGAVGAAAFLAYRGMGADKVDPAQASPVTRAGPDIGVTERGGAGGAEEIPIM